MPQVSSSECHGLEVDDFEADGPTGKTPSSDGLCPDNGPKGTSASAWLTELAVTMPAYEIVRSGP